MKFAHIADCHLGAWRQPEMQQLNMIAFEKAIDRCISEKLDFVLIAGDMFDNAIPSIDILKSAAAKLYELRENNIGCFLVQGSHDFSASGKSMISVLEKAGLCKDVSESPLKINCNGKSVFLAGLAGKKGGLEQDGINQECFKGRESADISILMIHTTVSELSDLPACVSSVSLKDIPDGFDYYALGHIHQASILESEGKVMAYPGSLFPTSFSELESQHSSAFLIIEADGGKISRENIRKIAEQIRPVENIFIDASGESPKTLEGKIKDWIEINKGNLNGAITSLKISGILESGKPSDVDFSSIEEGLKDAGAFSVIRNISKLESKEFELKIDEKEGETNDIGALEKLSMDAAVKESVIPEDKKAFAEMLLEKFNIEKAEDETNSTFNERVVKEISNVLSIEEDFV